MELDVIDNLYDAVLKHCERETSKERDAFFAALDELHRLARLGSAVEAMPRLASLSRRGTDGLWEAEDEAKGLWSGAKETPLDALKFLIVNGVYEITNT